MENISGNVSYTYYFAAMPWENGREFAVKVRSLFPKAIVYDKTATQNDPPYLKELKTAEDFLHGGGQSYEVERVFLPEYGCVMLAYAAESRVLCLSYHYGYDEKSSDELIAVRQSGLYTPIMFPDGTSRSFHDFAGSICRKLGIYEKPTGKSILIEITGMEENYRTAAELEEAEAPLLYGIISGDEGYAFVPEKTVKDGLRFSWGSREFIRLYAFGEAFLFINLIGSSERSEYLDRQEIFGNKTYGGVNDYFYMGSCPLTVNHGMLFSIEFVMILKALINGVKEYQGQYEVNRKPFYKRIKETNDYRTRVLTVLQKADNIEISEMGALERVLQESQRIDPLVDKVKYMLELLESDLNLLYSERSNSLITLLTIVGLLFALIQIILAIV